MILQVKEGKWTRTYKKDKFVCCDCCLAHRVEFGLKDKKLYSRWWRDDVSTNKYRKSLKNKKVLLDIIKKI